MKNWITYIDFLRPHAHRQAEAGLRRTARHGSASAAPARHESHDATTGDRFRADLSTR